MSLHRIAIHDSVAVYISDQMFDLLTQIAATSETKFNSLNETQKKLITALFNRNLLVRRRKNNEVSYSVRPGINWN